jgi:hypothetical protein
MTRDEARIHERSSSPRFAKRLSPRENEFVKLERV